jgi:PKD repeat protein
MKFATRIVTVLSALGLATVITFVTATLAVAQPSEVWVDDEYCDSCPNDGHTLGFDAFSKIQDGIDAVASPGIVHVAAGHYMANVTLKGGVQVLGAGADLTIIDGQNAGSVVTAIDIGSESVLDGFTITKGTGTPRGSYTYGGGIYVSNSSVIVRKSIITENRSSDGAGGIEAYDSTISLFNNNISQNNGWWGGAVTLHRSAAEIVANIIDQNNCGYGGAIFLDDSTQATIVNNQITGTSHAPPAIGIGESSTADIMNNTIADNLGNGIATGTYAVGFGVGSATITNCILWGNNDELVNLTATYSDIEDADTGEGNISAYPMFIAPTTGDYHLKRGSPAIDAGTSEGAPITDFDGDNRPIDGNGDGIAGVDIGADEADLLLSHDVAPLVMIPPTVELGHGTNFVPEAKVINIGTQSENGFTVTCEIKLIDSVIYSDMRSVSEIAILESIDIVFSDWIPIEVGEYKLKIYTQLAGDENTANDTQIRTVNVSILNADFTSDVTKGHVPLEVQFSDLSIGDTNQWLWDFGDGNVSNEQNPIHTYNSSGIYTVSLTISTAALSDTKTKIDFITVLPDVFGIEVGNEFTTQLTNQEGSYTSESEVTSIDQTTFPTTTYVIEIRENGETNRGWYEKTPGELKLWGTQEVSSGEFLRFSAGLVDGWYPMQVGDQRYTYATAEINLYPGIILNTSLTADVLAKEPVILDFDTFEAFKVRYKFRIWGYGEDETDTFYQWVVPYLGVVKYQDAEELEKLTSFAIGGGTITEETDTDGDGLKDYQELIMYNTDRLYADTDDDGFSDGDEVNTHGTDPNDPNSHPSRALPWIPLLLLGE